MITHKFATTQNQRLARVALNSKIQGRRLKDNRANLQSSNKLDYSGCSSNNPIQLATKIINRGQNYTYGPGQSTIVGQQMEAWLDPSDMRRGQSANINSSQNNMMDAIKTTYPNIVGNLVKGHLLNDNLGGSALGNNLFPITGTANHNHLYHVENQVKQAIHNNSGVYYKVQVNKAPAPHGGFDTDVRYATFENTIQSWNPAMPAVAGPLVSRIDVRSDLGSAPVTHYHKATKYIPTSSGKKAVPTLAGKKGATKPKSKSHLKKITYTATSKSWPSHPGAIDPSTGSTNLQTYLSPAVPAHAKEPKTHVTVANFTNPLLVLSDDERSIRAGQQQPFESESDGQTGKVKHKASSGFQIVSYNLPPQD